MEIQQNFANRYVAKFAKFCKIQKIQLDNLVDFEKFTGASRKRVAPEATQKRGFRGSLGLRS